MFFYNVQLLIFGLVNVVTFLLCHLFQVLSVISVYCRYRSRATKYERPSTRSWSGSDFRRIDIILLIYKALYFTTPPPRFQPYFLSCLLFYRLVAEVSYNSCTFPYSQMTKEQFSPVSTYSGTVPSITDFASLKISQNCRHYEVFCVR